jgi:hypothetical protein
MSLIKRSTGAETLTTDTISQVIGLAAIGEVEVNIVGDAGAGTLTMQRRMGKNDDWRTYAPGGTAQAFTTATLNAASDEHSETYILGGCEIRFSLATAGTLTIYVTGDHVDPKPLTYT